MKDLTRPFTACISLFVHRAIHIFYSNIVFDFKHDAAPIARHRLMAHSMSLGEVSCKTKCKKLQNRTIACRITGLSSQSSCWVCKQHTKKKPSFAWLLSTFLSAHQASEPAYRHQRLVDRKKPINHPHK